MNLEQALNVTIDDVLYRSADGQFSVVAATAEPSSERVVLVGELRDSAPGETLRVRGRFEQHATYGKRLRVTSFTPITPSTAAGIARYLGSGLIPGIGPAMAERLVGRFAERTLDVITTQSARLREVPGIGPQRAHAIAEAVRSRQAEAELMSFLHALGLGPSAAKRVRQKYGAEAASVVRDDPYLVAEQVPGIGFRTADTMASALGYAQDDPRRAAGAVLHLLGRAADEGHSFLLREELVSQASTLGVPAERASAALTDLSARDLVVLDDDAVYPPPLFRAEVEVAQRLQRLAARALPPANATQAIEAAMETWFAPAQRAAVAASFAHGLLLLTGGPGTGKTTTTRAIVQAHRAQGHRVLLCAPTGRAAKRLSDATSDEAKTIHRMLEWNPATGAFARGPHSALETDLLLVDEASMLDVQLAQRLLAALPKTASLVLVGDADQLPPVGPGPVLRELLPSGVGTVVQLTEVFRQAQESAIVRAAHEIHHGKRPTPTETGSRGSGDLFVVRASDPPSIQARLLETLQRMHTAYGLHPVHDVQVLTPMRKGPLGTEALNRLLQAALNPEPGLLDPRPQAVTARDARPRLRVGDKVMQLRNDYEREVWNGDLGTVTRVDAGVVFVDMGGKAVSYERDALDAVSLAYASTVHKVQGSEFPAVVVVLHSTHHVLLTRALLYTAVTRARKLVVILGDDRALARAIGNVQPRAVNTRLRARLLRTDSGA
jgi:exodeoxyribonuclease V alpha subunit